MKESILRILLYLLIVMLFTLIGFALFDFITWKFHLLKIWTYSSEIYRAYFSITIFSCIIVELLTKKNNE